MLKFEKQLKTEIALRLCLNDESILGIGVNALRTQSVIAISGRTSLDGGKDFVSVHRIWLTDIYNEKKSYGRLLNEGYVGDIFSTIRRPYQIVLSANNNYCLLSPNPQDHEIDQSELRDNIAYQRRRSIFFADLDRGRIQPISQVYHEIPVTKLVEHFKHHGPVVRLDPLRSALQLGHKIKTIKEEHHELS